MVVALVANSVQAGDGLLVDVPNALELIHFQTARGEVEHITHAADVERGLLYGNQEGGIFEEVLIGSRLAAFVIAGHGVFEVLRIHIEMLGEVGQIVGRVEAVSVVGCYGLFEHGLRLGRRAEERVVNVLVEDAVGRRIALCGDTGRGGSHYRSGVLTHESITGLVDPHNGAARCDTAQPVDRVVRIGLVISDGEGGDGGANTLRSVGKVVDCPNRSSHIESIARSIQAQANHVVGVPPLALDDVGVAAKTTRSQDDGFRIDENFTILTNGVQAANRAAII